MKQLLVVGLVAAVASALALVVAARRRQPEPSWEPGLEFNPDFDLSPEEILADIRGESPTA
ncbi:unannotated protein [freshwater metagenome]|jgi:hypothetical protein|uniref:Unannotated protein n=1 Tax=freshwater metagenome TaxID=449393 RepID=A0A6J6GLT6_9ZZZZ|nr:hypothetical protein [Actinomycetota bacterium]MSZ93047.1 hypothetical protein [Actinomycetota bacterium]